MRTRDRIKEHARAIGYIYNRRAASLRTSRSGIVGVVVHDIMNPFFAEILRSIESELDRSRQTFILSNHYDQLEKQRKFIDTLLQLGADGVIMSPAIGTPPEDILMAEENGLPAVLIARYVEGAGVPVFRGDDAYGIGACDQPSDLARPQAHRHDRRHRPDLDRARPLPGLCRRRWRRPGLRSSRTGAFPGRAPSRPASRRPASSWRLKDKPTAACCWNDLVAIGLMNGIARAGLVPGVDVSVTGYDDLEEAAIATPALTTVWNGQREVGRRAARALLDRLAAVGAAIAGTHQAGTACPAVDWQARRAC